MFLVRKFIKCSLGRLTGVTDVNDVVTGQYTYDGMNRRKTKMVNGDTVVFIYDVYNNLIGEYDGTTGYSNQEYIYLGTRPLATIEGIATSSSSGGCSCTMAPDWSIRTRRTKGAYQCTSSTNPLDVLIYLLPFFAIIILKHPDSSLRRGLEKTKGILIISTITIGSVLLITFMETKTAPAQIFGEHVYYYHLNHLGTPVMMTDQSQNVVWQASYDPFGQANISVSNITNNLRFPGQYADSETGLYYNMNRYYNPATGRYMEPDPLLRNPAIINSAAIINDYAYVENNPLRWTDPKGLYLGQYPPPPPGYDPSPEGGWTMNRWPNNGKWYLTAPDGTKYTVHREDQGHWRHWDKQGPGGNDEDDWPPNSGKIPGKRCGKNQSPCRSKRKYAGMGTTFGGYTFYAPRST